MDSSIDSLYGVRGEVAEAMANTFCRSKDLWQSRWGREPRVRLPVGRALRPPELSVTPPFGCGDVEMPPPSGHGASRPVCTLLVRDLEENGVAATGDRERNWQSGPHPGNFRTSGIRTLIVTAQSGMDLLEANGVGSLASTDVRALEGPSFRQLLFSNFSGLNLVYLSFYMKAALPCSEGSWRTAASTNSSSPSPRKWPDPIRLASPLAVASPRSATHDGRSASQSRRA